MRNQYKILAEKYNLITENNIGNLYFSSGESFSRGQYEWDGADLVTAEEIKEHYYGEDLSYYKSFNKLLPFKTLIKKLDAGEVITITGEEHAVTLCKDKDTLLKHNKDQRRQWAEEESIDEQDEEWANNQEEAKLNDLYNQIKARELLYKDNPGINIDI